MIADLLKKLATLTRSPGLPTVRNNGRIWHLTEAGVELFGPAGPPIERWTSDGTAVVVKANPGRTVYRVDLPAGPVFLKHCRISGPRSLGREIIRPPKARLEFDNARELRRRGLPVVEPLAWGASDSVWPGESFLITRGLAAVPFRDYLERTLPTLPPAVQRTARRRLAAVLAAFFARLHDAGVAHPDPHPGNLLVEVSEASPASEACPGAEVTPACVPRFVLIDVHDIRIGRPLSWAESRDNLALFNRWFQLRTHRPERCRFWRAYRRSRVTLPDSDAARMRSEAKEVERQTHARNLRLWAGREGRWLGTSRSVRRVGSGPFRGLAVYDLPEDFLTELLADPDAAFTRPDARVLKDCPTARVAVIEMPTPAGPVPVVLKRVNRRSFLDPLRNLVRRSQVLRSWVNGHALRDRWLPTPRPLAVFHRFRHGLPAEGYLLTELVPRVCPLRENVRAALVPLARMLRALHDRDVSHRDLKAPNILLADGTDPVLIDLVGVRTRVRLSVTRRAKELARLNASFVADHRVSRTDRLRFLLTYLRAGPELGVGWKSWWNMIYRATTVKVARNRRLGRVLG